MPFRSLRSASLFVAPSARGALPPSHARLPRSCIGQDEDTPQRDFVVLSIAGSSTSSIRCRPPRVGGVQRRGKVIHRGDAVAGATIAGRKLHIVGVERSSVPETRPGVVVFLVHPDRAVAPVVCDDHG